MTKVARFTWKSPDGVDHNFDLNAAEIAIGRAPTCDIVLPDDQMVSRRHAIVHRQDDVITVMDMGSSNGTLINGVEIHDITVLNDGDKLTIGDQDLYLTLKAADVPEPVYSAPTPSYFGNAPAPIANTPPPAEAPAYQPTPAFDMYANQETGMQGALVGQSHSLYSHTVNGNEVERVETMENYRDRVSYPQSSDEPAAPARQDAASLLATIDSLHAQLKDQLERANTASDRIRAGVWSALNQLEAAMSAAQSSTQQAEIADLQQIAESVSISPLVDQVANFARRATEIRDVLAAHQQLLDALNNVRRQLNQAANS